MYIGCSWSKALKFLIEKDSVNIDYIKSGVYGTFNEQFSNMRSMRPILLHGLGYFERTGMKNIEIIDFNLSLSRLLCKLQKIICLFYKVGGRIKLPTLIL